MCSEATQSVYWTSRYTQRWEGGIGFLRASDGHARWWRSDDKCVPVRGITRHSFRVNESNIMTQHVPAGISVVAVDPTYTHVGRSR